MAGTVREAKLQNPTQRKRLKSGRQPHWNTIVAGRDHLGWQRRPEDAAGRWIYRRRRSGDYTQLDGFGSRLLKVEDRHSIGFVARNGS